MGEAVSIGVAARRVVNRTRHMLDFQRMLALCPTAAVRESFIRSAWSHDVLNEDEASTLLHMPENRATASVGG